MLKKLAVLVLTFAATDAQAALKISGAATTNVNCSGGVCSATAKKAVLNATQLANMLASGDVKVSSGASAQDIQVNTAFSWTSTHRLTLDAYRATTFDKSVAVAGPGELTITTNDGGSGGDFTFSGSGHVEMWDLTSSLNINGRSYVLVNTVKSLASAVAANPSGAFAFVKSYDATADGTYQSTAVPTTFGGTLEGLGNPISNLSIGNPNWTGTATGMFAQTAQGSALRDVVLQHESVTDLRAGDSVGGLVAISYGSITGVFVDAAISAPNSIQSGIVTSAEYHSAITRTASSGSIVGNNESGGIVGNLFGSTLSWSHSSASVSGGGDLGGVIGGAYSDIGQLTIDHCYATGNIVDAGGSAGGLIGGSNLMKVIRSWSTGNVTAATGTFYVGGLIGDAAGSFVQDTYATGSVSGGNSGSVGGLVGNKYSDTLTSYSTGTVTGGSGAKVGGSIGQDGEDGIYNGDLYWDMDTSGITNPAQGAGNIANDNGIAGLTSQQLASGLPPGFDKSVWHRKKTINNGFPYLRELPPVR